MDTQLNDEILFMIFYHWKYLSNLFSLFFLCELILKNLQLGFLVNTNRGKKRLFLTEVEKPIVFVQQLVLYTE